MEFVAACHVHSSWSYDGSWGIDALAETFSGRGYRLLLMTEHDRGFTDSRLSEYREACAAATTEKLLVIPGIEYSDSANRVHVLVWGPVPFLGEQLETTWMLKEVARYGGVAVLAHPARHRAWECFRPEWADLLLGIELWNRKYDGWAPSESGQALLSQTSAIPFVGLDFHTQRQMFPLGMALDLEERFDETAVLDCLRRRRCAATAFGGPIDAQRFQQRLPLLRAAERGRRKIAALKRYAQARMPA